jgi:hypothetical protein
VADPGLGQLRGDVVEDRIHAAIEHRFADTTRDEILRVNVWRRRFGLLCNGGG